MKNFAKLNPSSDWIVLSEKMEKIVLKHKIEGNHHARDKLFEKCLTEIRQILLTAYNMIPSNNRRANDEYALQLKSILKTSVPKHETGHLKSRHHP